MVKNSLRFCLSGNVLISPSLFKDSFAGYRILGILSWQILSFNTWIYPPTAFLPPNFLIINLLIILLRTACVWPFAFLLLLLRFSLSLNFNGSIIMIAVWISLNSCYLDFIDLRVFFWFFVFLAALGLHCCMQGFSSCGKWGLLFVAVRGLLTVVASLVVEHGL